VAKETIQMGTDPADVFEAEYGGVTAEQHEATVRQNLQSREAEIYAYQLNINNFREMVKDLNRSLRFVDWPDELLPFKGKSREQVAATAPPDQLNTIVDLQFRDELKQRLTVERMEQRKAKLALKFLATQLPPEPA